MRKQKDLIGTSKDLVSRLISQDILVHYLLEDGRMETEEGKKLPSIADKSEKVSTQTVLLTAVKRSGFCVPKHLTHFS